MSYVKFTRIYQPISMASRARTLDCYPPDLAER